jgi:hypothetical protein
VDKRPLAWREDDTRFDFFQAIGLEIHYHVGALDHTTGKGVSRNEPES